MEKTKIISLNETNWQLSVPTMRAKLQIEALIARMTTGSAALMAISGTNNATDALNLAYKLARLQTLVTKLDKENKPVPDYSFYDLDDDSEDFINNLHEELDKFIKEYKDGSR